MLKRRFQKYSKYSWENLSGDVFGGFIASLIAFPYGLAMASLMGLPPILGVFTSILTAPITALLGRNPVMFGGVSHRLPAPLIGIGVAILLATIFGWSSREVGLLPSSMPPFIGFQWRPS